MSGVGGKFNQSGRETLSREAIWAERMSQLWESQEEWNSRWRERRVQRPWGGRVSGAFEDRREDQ